jgi:hypothetical protein
MKQGQLHTSIHTFLIAKLKSSNFPKVSRFGACQDYIQFSFYLVISYSWDPAFLVNIKHLSYCKSVPVNRDKDKKDDIVGRTTLKLRTS